MVENDTVNEVAVAAVTLPIAPLLNTTVLLPAVGLKPKPLMVIVVALAARFAVLVVTTGTTVATWTPVPLLTLLLETEAVKLPADVGLVLRVTVKLFPVPPVTVPTAPLLNVTVLSPGVVSNAYP